MSQIDLSGLDLFRADSEGHTATVPEKPGVRPWSPVLRRKILCFDQSIANTGWALIHGNEVRATGNIKTEGATGIGAILDIIPEIYREYRLLIDFYDADIVAHESPPAGGGKLRNPESSVVAATAIRLAVEEQWRHKSDVRMIQAQKAKKRWTGSGRATKAEVKAAILSLVPGLAKVKPLNQAITDALAVGMLASEEE